MKTSEFITKLNDPELVKKMSEAKSPEEAYAVAKAAGVTDSFETFVAEMEKLKAAVGELSEDDLASVAGGMCTSEIVTQVVTAVVPAALSAASAAI